MKVRDRLAAINRLQQSTAYKVVASIVLVLVVAGLVTAYAVGRAADAQQSGAADLMLPETVDIHVGEDATEEQAAAVDEFRSSIELTNKAINDLLDRRTDWSSVAIGAGVGLGVSLAVVWLGVSLTVLGIVCGVALVCAPLIAGGHARIPLIGFTTRELGLFLSASAALAMSFSVLLAASRLALSGAGPIRAIARNVIAEAVRMKVSLVFIVLLIFLLATIPGLLNEDTPLRYRVQSFLQYGAGGAYWVVAILAVFLSVGTVAFEQRDRVIWQTATKPVPAWRYLMGKWVGVSVVSAVLLSVSVAGVFLFTEYLRNTPAEDEVRPYVVSQQALARGDTGRVSEDRLILETQILASRAGVRPEYQMPSKEEVEEVLGQRIAEQRRSDPNFNPSAADVNQMAAEIENAVLEAQRSIAPGQSTRFTFRGLDGVRSSGRSLTLQYRFDAGGNNPTDVYDLSFFYPNIPQLGLVTRQAAPDQTLTLAIPPAAVTSEGVLELVVFHGEFDGSGIVVEAGRQNTIVFAPDGIVVYYPTGSYHLNFIRAAFVLWLKICFLSAVGIATATALSFSVASLVSFGVMLVAESSRFLNASLEYYSTVDRQGDLLFGRMIIRFVAVPIATLFRQYGNVRPVYSLVNGQQVSWLQVGVTTIVLGLASGACFLVGWAIFRKRELATYSGQ